MGVYIVHPKCENTRMPKILAYKRDKVIPKRSRFGSNIQKSQGQQFRYAGGFRYHSENFASLAKFYRDSEIEKFRYQQ